MLQRVGFDRQIRLKWLDKVVEVYRDEKNPKEIKVLLNEYLENEIKSKDNRRKSINILIRTWVNVSEEHVFLRDKALKLFHEINVGEKVIIHWCMLLLAYPLFYDITSIIGKLLSLQDEFSLSMVRRRVYEIWGERSTVQYAIDKVLRSIHEWGTVMQECKKGEYKAINPIIVENIELKLFLIECYLISSKKQFVNYMELSNLKAIFPFKVSISLNEIYQINNLKINRMGGEIAVSL